MFLAVAAILVIRFLRTGGPAMLRMDAPMEHAAATNDPEPAHAAHESSGSATYTCPMHPEVEGREGGACPKCGMKLVPM